MSSYWIHSYAYDLKEVNVWKTTTLEWIKTRALFELKNSGLTALLFGMNLSFFKRFPGNDFLVDELMSEQERHETLAVGREMVEPVLL